MSSVRSIYDCCWVDRLSEKEDKDEAGLYRYKFNVVKSWANKEIFIVFDGSMTDTEVKVLYQVV
jgi:beta-galactosidase/beta-glucuronidase